MMKSQTRSNIIYCSSVMICVVNENEIRARTKCYLNRGESFGVSGILLGSDVLVITVSVSE